MARVALIGTCCDGSFLPQAPSPWHQHSTKTQPKGHTDAHVMLIMKGQ